MIRPTKTRDSALVAIGFGFAVLAYAPQGIANLSLIDEVRAVSLSRFIRTLSLLCVLAGSLPVSARLIRFRDLLLLFGIIVAISMFITRRAGPDLAMEALFWNGPVALAITSLLSVSPSSRSLSRVWLVLAIMQVGQLSFGLLLIAHGQGLSETGAVSGWVGNANMFALLNVLVAVRFWGSSWAGSAIGATCARGVAVSGSLAGVIALSVALAVWVARANPIRWGLLTVAALMGLQLLRDSEWQEHWFNLPAISHIQFKLAALTSAASHGETLGSRSIELRAEVWRTLADAMIDMRPEILFGGFHGLRYVPADSQAVTYIASFGLPTAAMLFAPVLAAHFDVFRERACRPRTMIALVVITFFIVVNRCFDYFTGAMLTGLVLADARSSHERKTKRQCTP